MAFAQAATRRPIAGAVATVGVSDRVAFLRKTYGLLGVSLVAFALLTAGVMKYATAASLHYSLGFLGRSPLTAVLVMALFIGVGMFAQKLAFSESSRGVQYVGLGLTVALQSLLLQPILWILILSFGNKAAIENGTLISGLVGHILMQAVVITLSIFVGLTLTVFITRKDFSFMAGALSIASFAILGIALASWLFGFSLGALYVGGVALLMAGYVLYYTSQIMSYFPPSGYVGAALLLFSTVATMFRAILMLLIQLNGSRR